MLTIEPKQSSTVLHGGAEPMSMTIVSPAGSKPMAMGCGMYTVAPGRDCTLHVHQRKAEMWVIVKGRGLLRMGGEQLEVEAGYAIYTPAGTPHGMRNIGDEPLVFVDVTHPKIGRDPETNLPLDSMDLEE